MQTDEGDDGKRDFCLLPVANAVNPKEILIGNPAESRIPDRGAQDGNRQKD
jgi:hypothetical protein